MSESSAYFVIRTERRNWIRRSKDVKTQYIFFSFENLATVIPYFFSAVTLHAPTGSIPQNLNEHNKRLQFSNQNEPLLKVSLLHTENIQQSTIEFKYVNQAK